MRPDLKSLTSQLQLHSVSTIIISKKIFTTSRVSALSFGVGSVVAIYLGMKTQALLNSILLLTSTFSLTLAGCGKSSSSSGSSTSSTSYYYSNGYCYSSSTGTVVSSSYCSSTTGYYYSNGYCYSSSSGSIVNTSYCQSTTSTGQQCYGYFYYNVNGYFQMAYCNGSNCRGSTLLNAATNQWVTCQ